MFACRLLQSFHEWYAYILWERWDFGDLKSSDTEKMSFLKSSMLPPKSIPDMPPKPTDPKKPVAWRGQEEGGAQEVEASSGAAGLRRRVYGKLLLHLYD